MNIKELHEAARNKGVEIVAKSRPSNEVIVGGASGQTYTVMNGVLYAYMGEASWSGRARDVEAHYFLVLGTRPGYVNCVSPQNIGCYNRNWREQLGISDTIPHELYVPIYDVSNACSEEVGNRLGKDKIFQALQSFAKDAAGLMAAFAEKNQAAAEKAKKADEEAKEMLQAFK